MVIDYSERRQSQRIQQKRPPRPSAWPYALLILFLIVAAYLLGIGTGWFLYRPGGKLYKTVVQPQLAAPKPAQPQPPPAAQKVPQHPAAQPAVENSAPIPLTFYNTLQKGNKSLMGTGINTPKEGQGAAPKPVAPPAPER